MTKRRLLLRLREIEARGGDDPLRNHSDADRFLLEYIDDEDVTNAFISIDKLYED